MAYTYTITDNSGDSAPEIVTREEAVAWIAKAYDRAEDILARAEEDAPREIGGTWRILRVAALLDKMGAV